MSRIKRGWALSKKSWGLLNEHRQLLRFPLYGGIASTLLAIVTLGPGLYLFDQGSLGGAIPLVVLGIYVLSVIGLYFSVGLAACADMIFRGQQATMSGGLAVSRQRFSQICGWAAVSTAISVLMGALENQGGLGGQIAARLVGTAWSLVTFLAVPVIAIEGTGPLQTLKRSASMFKKRWGQQIAGDVVIGGVVFLLGVLPAILLIVAGVMIWASASFAWVNLREAPLQRDDLGLGLLRRRPAGRDRRDRLPDRDADLQRPARHLRRRPLPLRARRRDGRRLHRRGAGVGREAKARHRARHRPHHRLAPLPLPWLTGRLTRLWGG